MLNHRTRHPEKSADDADRTAFDVHTSRERDVELARRLAENRPGALEEIIEQHGEHLRKLIRGLCGSPFSADDLLQETLLKAWAAAESYRGEAPLRHWLTRIAIRVGRNHQRGYRRWMVHLKSLWQRRTQTQQGDSTIVEFKQDAMHQAMNQLSYADRELLVLYYIEEQSLGQLAAQLSVRENTLQVRLHRSRERLKALLQKNEEIL